MEKISLNGIISADFSEKFVVDIINLVLSRLRSEGLYLSSHSVIESEEKILTNSYKHYRAIYKRNFIGVETLFYRGIIRLSRKDKNTFFINIVTYILIECAEIVNGQKYDEAKQSFLKNSNINDLYYTTEEFLYSIIEKPVIEPQKETINNLLSSLTSEFTQYSDWSNQLKSKLETKTDQCSSLEKENENLMKRIQEKENENANLQADNLDLTQKYDSIYELYMDCKLNLDLMTKEAAKAKTTLETLLECSTTEGYEYADDLEVAKAEAKNEHEKYVKERKEHDKTKKLLAKAQQEVSSEKKQELEKKFKFDSLCKIVESAKSLFTWEEAKAVRDCLLKIYRRGSDEDFDKIDEIEAHFREKENAASVSTGTNSGIVANSIKIEMPEAERQKLTQKQ